MKTQHTQSRNNSAAQSTNPANLAKSSDARLKTTFEMMRQETKKVLAALDALERIDMSPDHKHLVGAQTTIALAYVHTTVEMLEKMRQATASANIEKSGFGDWAGPSYG